MDPQFSEKLKLLVHAARNDLNVITMGVQSLSDLAAEPEKFQEILDVIEDNGIKPLRLKLESLSHLNLNSPSE